MAAADDEDSETDESGVEAEVEEEEELVVVQGTPVVDVDAEPLHPGSVNGLTALLANVDSAMPSALAFCKAEDVDDVMQIVLTNSCDAFMGALGFQAGGLKDKLVRGRLAALT